MPAEQPEVLPLIRYGAEKLQFRLDGCPTVKAAEAAISATNPLVSSMHIYWK